MLSLALTKEAEKNVGGAKVEGPCCRRGVLISVGRIERVDAAVCAANGKGRKTPAITSVLNNFIFHARSKISR
jgi:hypothetical protein